MSVPYDDFCANALELAQSQSIKRENGYVGTEHILWGILEAQGDLYKLLKGRKIDIDALFQNLEPTMSDYSGLSREKGPKTPRVRKILVVAETDALKTMEPKINEEILVRALLSAGRGSAVRAMESLNLNCDELIEELESSRRKELKEKASWLMQDQKPLVGQPIPRQYFPLHGQNLPYALVSPPREEAPSSPFEQGAIEKTGAYGRLLSYLAEMKKLRPVTGRRREIEEICLCLRRATANNPVLVGEKGVGKTSVIEGMAQLIAEREVHDYLKSAKIVEVSGSKLFQALEISKEEEDKFKTFIKRSTFPPTILFLDGVLELLNEERVPWPLVSAINYIKAQVEEGFIRIIISTTPKTWERRILTDPILSKCCQKIEIEELSSDDALQTLKSRKQHFESHHGVEVKDENIDMLIEFSMEYVKDGFLPGKAIDLLDEACCIAGSRRSAQEKSELLEQDIILATSKKSGLPVEKISRKAKKFKSMEDEIRRRIVGQDEAIKVVCDRIKLFMTGLHEEHRPLGVLFFAGPTGVGKTELAKVVATYLFGSESHFHRFDMSEYAHHHEVSRLIGAPPGYLGFEEEGQLTGKVKSDPYCVILLDEIEKAHPRIFEIFLQVFDAGRLTDGKGETVDFRNTLVIMTSNLGSDLLDDERTLGFRQRDQDKKKADRREKMISCLKEKFSPEFVNRINEVVLFNTLTVENIRAISLLIISEWGEKIKKHGVNLEVAQNLLDHLCREGYSKEFGVRNLKRVIENILIVPLSRAIIEESFSKDDTILAEFKEDQLNLAKKEG